MQIIIGDAFIQCKTCDLLFLVTYPFSIAKNVKTKKPKHVLFYLRK